MRNRNRVWIGMLGCLWLLAGCSSGGGEYEKLMASADKAMESLDVDTAIAQYRKVAEMDPEKLKYGEGRLVIASELLMNAEELKGRLDELKSRTEEVKKSVAGLDIENAEAEEVVRMNGELSDIQSNLEEFSTTSLYKEISDLRNQFMNDIKTKRIDPIVSGIEASIGKLEFNVAESGVAELRQFAGGFSEVVGSIPEDFSSRIEMEKAKYIEFPVTYTNREVVLLQNDAGKITFLGEGVRQNELVLVYKYEGEIRLASTKVAPEIQAVFSDGSSVELDEDDTTFRHFPDHTIAYQPVSDDPAHTLVRLDYRFGMNEDETYKKAEIGPAGETATLKEIAALPDTELQPSLSAVNGKMTVEISKIAIQERTVTVEGKLTSGADVSLETPASLYVPSHELFDSNWMNEELFAGVGKEFAVQFDLRHRIPAEAKHLKFYIAGVQVNIDLATGKEYAPSGQELLTQQIIVPGEETDVTEGFDDWNDTFLEDGSGNLFADGIAFIQKYHWTESPSFSVGLNQQYKRLTAKVAVDKLTTGSEYGSSKVKVMGDGKVLKILPFSSAKSAPLDLDVNVSGVRTLEFIIAPTPGKYGETQRIIIGDGVLTP
ncbi:NPCBM/NEW2 domain-containing protein [Paenibacillus sp. FSL R5-0810]|uniref:NPCBM/NEW2 domain-containing protein n=1 Tax=Paenibacillus sp. FSL R5-0810 TaxID=2921659 RepID=UPI0030FC4023